MLNDLKSHSQACLCIHVHTHHRVTHSNDLRKVINPRDIPVVTVHNFTKIAIPHPLPFKLKTMSQIFPSPGAENPIHPLVGPGVYARGLPPGQANDMCIIFLMFTDRFALFCPSINYIISIVPL